MDPPPLLEAPYTTKPQKIDMAALLPMSAASRSAHSKGTDMFGAYGFLTRFFEKCAESLHKALVNNSKQVRLTSHLGSGHGILGPRALKLSCAPS